ncbi:hypothetical protein [Photorhabdus temperata]|uniref:Uncharacterized protein n=1 Tax=Photorhabdus temperata subsp. temperata Meg1 TaxID=1393735 RepID=A0A081RVH4_PHOTE|nr:hypothetical protein [Photorhabdus temperata]KER02677.1 hypothetical protein MEG1DRAFT_02716 [Photorhabdus temperata subsp. temperata Meg1]
MANYIEHYIKMTQEANRVLALKAEEIGSELRDVAEDTVDLIERGATRAIWRTSYFFDGYEDVNTKINSEDKRMILTIWNIVNGTNFSFIKEVAKVFTDELLKNQNEETKKIIYLKLLKVFSNLSTSKATKYSISIVIADAIYLSLIRNVVIRNAIRKFANGALFTFQSYGYFDKATVSADKLKRECPLFYWALYNLKLEMLYFIFEPVLSKGVSLIGKKCSEDDIVSEIIGIINHE